MKLILHWVWCRFIWARIAYPVTWLCSKIPFHFIHIVFLFTKHLISGRLIQLLHACIWYSLKSPLIIYAETLEYILPLQTATDMSALKNHTEKFSFHILYMANNNNGKKAHWTHSTHSFEHSKWLLSFMSFVYAFIFHIENFNWFVVKVYQIWREKRHAKYVYPKIAQLQCWTTHISDKHYNALIMQKAGFSLLKWNHRKADIQLVARRKVFQVKWNWLNFVAWT